MNTEVVEQPSTGIVAYSATEQALAHLRVKYRDVKYDLTTTKGDKEARAARLELVTLRTSLEVMRKEIKAPAQAYSRLIDAEAARITAEITVLERPIVEQIRADETRRDNERQERARKEQLRRDDILAKIEGIRRHGDLPPSSSSAALQAFWNALDAIVITPEEYHEYVSNAQLAKSNTLDKIGAAAVQALAAEEAAIALQAQKEALAIEAETLRLERKAITAQRQALLVEQQALDDAKRAVAEFVPQVVVGPGPAEVETPPVEQPLAVKDVAAFITQLKSGIQAQADAPPGSLVPVWSPETYTDPEFPHSRKTRSPTESSTPLNPQQAPDDAPKFVPEPILLAPRPSDAEITACVATAFGVHAGLAEHWLSQWTNSNQESSK